MLSMDAIIRDRVKESIAVKKALILDTSLVATIARIAQDISDALGNGNKVIFAGNGGSFADSIHLAAEFVSRFQRERIPLASVALGTNSSILTAVGNDYGYELVFAREIGALGRVGDVFIGLSTSGNSITVIKAVEVAKDLGITTYCLTGEDGGELKDYAECVRVPSGKTARIQESHILIGHIICELVEDNFVGK